MWMTIFIKWQFIQKSILGRGWLSYFILVFYHNSCNISGESHGELHGSILPRLSNFVISCKGNLYGGVRTGGLSPVSMVYSTNLVESISVEVLYF